MAFRSGTASYDALALRQSVRWALSFAFLLWLIKAIEWAAAIDLSFLGVYPRTPLGAIGILTSPLIHGDEFHLLSNTFPLITLGIGLFYFYRKIAPKVFLWIYLLTGLSVWFVAREAYHVGASGIIYGMMSFLFFIGLFQKDSKSVAISLIIMFLYSGMLAGMAPGEEHVSHESHLMGAAAGLVVAFIYRKKAPVPGIEERPEEDLEDADDDAQETPKFEDPSHTHPDSGATLVYHYQPDDKAEKTLRHKAAGNAGNK